jgi:hypothetical protein
MAALVASAAQATKAVVTPGMVTTPLAAEDDFYSLVGPPAFGYWIRSAPTPRKFGAPSIDKYNGETYPKI